MRTAWQGFWTGAAAGVSALAVLVAGLVGQAPLALGLGLGLLAAVALVANPFLGAAALAAFSHLDAVEKALFGFLPVSAFKLIAAATAVAMLLNAARVRPTLRRALREPIFILATAFVALAASGVMIVDDRALAIDIVTRMASLYLLSVIVMLLADTENRVEVLTWILILTSLASALILLVEFSLGVTLVAQSEAATTARTAEGIDRSSGGSDYNPTTAASLLLVGVVYALVLFLESPRHRGLMLIVILFGSLAVILSFARSAALAYGITLILLAWRYRRSRYLPLAVMAGFLGLLAMLPFIPAEYWERIASIFGGSGDWTLGRRMTYNVIGVELLFESPAYGVGPGQFEIRFTDPEYRYLPGRTLLGRELHNMYLSVLVQYGVIGGLAFFAMLYQSFRRLGEVVRNPATEMLRVQALAGRYAFGAYLITSLFLPNEYTKYTWLLPAIAVAIGFVNRASLEGRQTDRDGRYDPETRAATPSGRSATSPSKP